MIDEWYSSDLSTKEDDRVFGENWKPSRIANNSAFSSLESTWESLDNG